MKKPKSWSKPSAISEEYVAESGEEHGDSEASSSSGSEESSAEPSPKPTLKRKRPFVDAESSRKDIPTVELSSASEGEQSDSSAGREEESESEAQSENPRQTDVRGSKKKEKGPSIRASVPAKPFIAPSGFTASPADGKRTKRTESLLSNLKGKGLWHITAPASVPLTLVEQFALDAIGSGESVLSIKGDDYRFRPETIRPDNQRRLLLWDRTTKFYKATPHAISQTLHIQQIVDPPQAFEQSEEQQRLALEEAAGMPYSQPKGMKMRFRPIGTEDAPPETMRVDSSDESDRGEAVFRIPPGHDSTSDTQTNTPKKSKSVKTKAKAPKSQDPEVNGTNLPTKPKKSLGVQERNLNGVLEDKLAVTESPNKSRVEKATVGRKEDKAKRKNESAEVERAKDTNHSQENGNKKKKRHVETDEQVEVESVTPEKSHGGDKKKKKSREAV